ncbi:MAG: hypothetical protein J6K25_10375 [Thermoguttaceae bacterium]|nr:hypothetical protein [Thermoguttaceae bacterium]
MVKEENFRFESPEYVEGVCRIQRIERAIVLIENRNFSGARKALENAVDCEYADLAEKFGDALEASDVEFHRLYGVRRSPTRLTSFRATTEVDRTIRQRMVADDLCREELTALAERFNEFRRRACESRTDAEKVLLPQYMEAVATAAEKLATQLEISRQRAIAFVEASTIRRANRRPTQ